MAAAVSVAAAVAVAASAAAADLAAAASAAAEWEWAAVASVLPQSAAAVSGGSDRRRRFPFCCDRRRRFPFGGFAGAGFRGGNFAVNRFHGRLPQRIPSSEISVCGGVGLGLGYGYYNGYYDYGYRIRSYDNAYYYGDSGCYIVRRSVLTPYGWRIRPVQVCG